ncbi:hypothetical protein AB0D37_07545 [Streptomyces sp. NPDC048384]|uniref:hypothetical protein n=1 Tax=Streptomyces sp. NPDC048384 TaxID=3155487 RepID=UPI00343F1BC8
MAALRIPVRNGATSARRVTNRSATSDAIERSSLGSYRRHARASDRPIDATPLPEWLSRVGPAEFVSSGRADSMGRKDSMGKKVWITAALTAAVVASGIGVTAYGAPEPGNGGFPAGRFKIKNEKTGECIQAFLGHESDTLGGGDPNPYAGRIIQAAGPRPCENTKDQVWKYDAAQKRLESLGVDGNRCLVLNPYVSIADLLLSQSLTDLSADEKELASRVEPGVGQAARKKTPGWNLSLGWCGEAPSGPMRVFPFRTRDGLIRSAYDTGGVSMADSFLTAEEDGGITGRVKGEPGQQWTFPVAP